MQAGSQSEGHTDGEPGRHTGSQAASMQTGR